MLIKKIKAKKVKDSRKKETICVIVKTSKGKFATSAPAGKSTGKHEVRSYMGSLIGDIQIINNLDVKKINIKRFGNLRNVEKLVGRKIGGNSLFALESSLLKALAKENGKELWRFLKDESFRDKIKFPRPVGNAIGGGLHSKGVRERKPDFQEFLFIGKGKNFKESIMINELAYKIVKKFLEKSWRKMRNDEGAWETGLSDEEVLMIMDKTRGLVKEKGYEVDIGLDIAGSSFFKNDIYYYQNPKRKLDKDGQIDFIKELIDRYKIFYIEDALNEDDFSGFRNLLLKVGRNNCLIAGDDLTTTNPVRLKKAIRTRAINAIIVKPNQIGSLLKVKEVIDICKRYNIKTIISHRSGETKDNTIADLGIGFEVDFIKTGIYGSVRKSKLKRVAEIEKGLTY